MTPVVQSKPRSAAIRGKLARWIALGIGLLAASCSPTSAIVEEDVHAVSDITLNALQPALVVPGSTLVLTGSSFLPDFAGPTTLVLRGEVDGQAVTTSLPATFVDYGRMEVQWPGAAAFGGGSGGQFVGEARLQVESQLDGLRHRSPVLSLKLELRAALEPQLDSLQNETIFVNDPLVAHGDAFLLGGQEGDTVAIFNGCFVARGDTVCKPVEETEVVARPVSPFDRRSVVFPFSPHIAGIEPGSFRGEVSLINRHGDQAGNVSHGSGAFATENPLVEPAVFKLAPAVASLGQFVDVRGGGFVGPEEGADATSAVTTIELEGTFTRERAEPQPAKLVLVPQFVSGQLVRYVVNEEDELGKTLEVRTVAGAFSGTARPVVRFGKQRVEGSTTKVAFAIGHVKQVVWLDFRPSYLESLRRFGLRPADMRIRERVFEVVRRDYRGLNVTFRERAPSDFALFAKVEIGGPDLNGIGLLGYDNTPGKDIGNLRLHDRIGGVNALTQLDGYPGYGGVFVESLFTFSKHPAGFAPPGGGHEAFDQLFDPFRPDLEAVPLSAQELAGIPVLTSSEGCPASGGARAQQAGCAIWTLGSLIGTTLSHEIAHSLGLADPSGEGFHNPADLPGALMDAGGARGFLERAELAGEGPGVFCQSNFDYLRKILPGDEPDPIVDRKKCY